MSDKSRVLFVCAKNDVRSLMAEALLRHSAPGHFEAFSAGLAVGGIDQRTLEVLQHIGVDASGLRSKSIDEFQGQDFHYIVALCDKSSEEALRMPSSNEVMSWNFEDPTISEKPEPFRHVLQEIHDRIKMFVTVKTRHALK